MDFFQQYGSSNDLRRTKARYLFAVDLILFFIIILGTVFAHLHLPYSASLMFLFAGDIIGFVFLILSFILIFKGAANAAGWIFVILVPVIFFLQLVFADLVSETAISINRAGQSATAGIAFYFFITLFAFSARQMLVGIIAMLAELAFHTLVIFSVHYNSTFGDEDISFLVANFLVLAGAGVIAFLAIRMNQRALKAVISSNLDLEKKVAERTEELRIAKEYAEQLARTDTLSGLKNRRSVYEEGETEVQRSKRYSRCLSAIMIDIDHFKKINDTYGHHAGDAALKQVSNIISSNSREMDISGRIGGEEFVILLPETCGEKAETLAERIRTHVESTSFIHEDTAISLTISLGISYHNSSIENLDKLLDNADKALYQAKRKGRNQVVIFNADSSP